MSAKYLHMLQSLLPGGPAWTRDPDAVLTKMLDGFAVELQRVEDRAVALVEEADVRTATDLLDEWENLLGLPSSCISPTTTAGRRTALAARLQSDVVATLPNIQSVAADLGYPPVTITESTGPFQAGISAAGDPLNSDEMQYVWEVDSPVLANYDQLDCTVTDMAQSHTLPQFKYHIYDRPALPVPLHYGGPNVVGRWTGHSIIHTVSTTDATGADIDYYFFHTGGVTRPVLRSTNTIDWTEMPTNFYGITEWAGSSMADDGAGTIISIGGEYSTGLGRLLYSEDYGANWFTHQTNLGRLFHGISHEGQNVTYGENKWWAVGQLGFVAVNKGNPNYQTVNDQWYLITFAAGDFSKSKHLVSVATDSTVLADPVTIAVGEDGVIIYIDTLGAATVHGEYNNRTAAGGYSGSFLAVATNGSEMFCAVGEDGEIQVANEANNDKKCVTWTSKFSGEPFHYIDVAYNATTSTWAAMATDGNIYFSHDNWATKHPVGWNKLRPFENIYLNRTATRGLAVDRRGRFLVGSNVGEAVTNNSFVGVTPGDS